MFPIQNNVFVFAFFNQQRMVSNREKEAWPPHYRSIHEEMLLRSNIPQISNPFVPPTKKPTPLNLATSK